MAPGVPVDSAVSTKRVYEDLPNEGTPGISYFSPLQSPPAGTAIDPQPSGIPIPKLFQPLKLRGITVQNRIFVSPMCQYSAEDGHANDWHLAHLGGILSRGPGFTITEVASITPEGRISPQDLGIWSDTHIAPLKRLTEFAHSQGQRMAIQIGHAGRKATTTAPWISRKAVSSANVGGWPDNVIGPSPIPFDENTPTPREMTLEDIEQLKVDWVAAIKRAIAAGFDAIEIHAAHGYLLSEFYSPASNKRTDKYGGSFENRIRLLLEILDLTRQNIPAHTPIFIRYNGSDWIEHIDEESWKIEDAIRLGVILAKTGQVDFLDVSSSGNDSRQKITAGPGYQAHFSRAVREAIRKEGIEDVAVGVVGILTDGPFANSLLEDGAADVALVGRGFQRNPALVWTWAEELGVEARVANQIGWGWKQRQGGGIKPGVKL